MGVFIKPWTYEEIRKMREGFESGLTAQKIADGLPGRTRNSFMGMKFRLGLSVKRPEPLAKKRDRSKPTHENVVVELNPTAKPKPSLSFVNIPVDDNGKVVHLPKPVVHRFLGKGDGVLLVNRHRLQCAYILGAPNAEKTLCCGELVHADTSWCSYHRELVYVPVRERGASHGRSYENGRRAWVLGRAIGGNGS